MPRNYLIILQLIASTLFVVMTGTTLHAQTAAAPARPQSGLGGCRASELQSSTNDLITKPGPNGDERILVLAGQGAVPVRVDCDGMQFFADHALIYLDRHLVEATGNVLFVSSGNRISAERMSFDTRARTGVFYNASGMASMGERVDRSMFGTQEPDAIFWGKEIHKVGPKKYKIKGGNFTTCLQPTPRWDIAAGNVDLVLDDYAVLLNSVFRVKGVPLMYLPFFYYPIQEDDRATGFLIPTYGASTYRGQTLSNAFFWAIGRSHDATFVHDWFSKTGQQVGGEYRYQLGGGSQGTARAALLDEHEYDDNGITRPAKRSYRVNGGITQNLGGGLRGRASADFFSDIRAQQQYQQNVHQATNRTRQLGGNVTGNWREYVLSATLDRNDVFYTETDYQSTGGLPRINFSRGERPIGKSPIYFGFNAESASIIWKTERNDVVVQDKGLTRIDVNPYVRIPLSRWPFLSINSSVSWRGTYWNESLDANGVQVPEAINRRFFDFSARITGPVFSRVFMSTEPDARKVKHVIEPWFAVQRVTAIDIFDQIVQLESLDYIVGNVTRLTYGLNNRLYAKKTVSREVLNVGIQQSYYTDARAAQFDQQYQSGFTFARPNKYSPVAVTVRTSPNDRLQAEVRTEWNTRVDQFQSITANGTVNSTHIQASAGWSQRRFIPELPGFDNQDFADNFVNASVNWRGPSNKIGGNYSFNYDLRRDRFIQQRYLAYYNAQCCGVAVEYQTFNFQGGFAGFGIPQDRRFNVSFTLAGIGTFSNFLGAFGGQTGR
jgi:LPS-assembly protein